MIEMINDYNYRTFLRKKSSGGLTPQEQEWLSNYEREET